MALFSRATLMRIGCLLAALAPVVGQGQANFGPEGGEYNIGGAVVGEQVFPQASIRTTGGYLVWQDNVTDGSGLGISALKLDSSLSSVLSPFRVNQIANLDQSRPSVSMLNSGGAVFVWQGGRQGFRHIYARFLAADGTWQTGDVPVNTATNVYQIDPGVATLPNNNAVVVWSSFDQAAGDSMRDIYFQLFAPTGAKVGTETRVNQAIAFNQRSSSLTSLADGRFLVVWVSEQQRFENSVDVYGRLFAADGTAASGEFLINSGTNVCASPTVARSSDGGFAVAWTEKNTDVAVRSNSWDVVVRAFSSVGAGGTVRRVNTWRFGDQLMPQISAVGTDYLVVWTSMGQDGSREGVYGQFLRSDGSPAGGEFRVNSTTVSQQIQPCVASDGVARFLSVWTSFVGGASTFDLYAQRYVNTSEPLPAPGAPFVSVLSSNQLAVSWPPVQGFSIAKYEVYADGAATPSAETTNIYWRATGLAPSSTHSYRLAYVLADGRRSPLSATGSNTTYGGGATWGGIPQEWMRIYYGDDIYDGQGNLLWPAPNSDTDGDGASLLQEFQAGTDPTSASSVLRQRIVRTAQGPFLNWNTQPGMIYQVQMATNLGGWQNVGGPRFAAGYLDSIYVGGGGRGFFRVTRLR